MSRQNDASDLSPETEGVALGRTDRTRIAVALLAHGVRSNKNCGKLVVVANNNGKQDAQKLDCRSLTAFFTARLRPRQVARADPAIARRRLAGTVPGRGGLYQ